jgi:hypothetical protein
MAAQASLISFDVADTLSDTQFRGRSRFCADGIAVRCLVWNATQPSTDTVELRRDGLKDRTVRRPGVEMGFMRSRL